MSDLSQEPALGASYSEAQAGRFSALHVEGAIRHPDVGETWEYMVLVTVKNEKGEEIGRHMVDVGALGPRDHRTFDLSVEVFTEPKSKR